MFVLSFFLKFNYILCHLFYFLTKNEKWFFCYLFSNIKKNKIKYIKFIISLRWKHWGLKVNLEFYNFFLINFLHWKFSIKFELYVSTSSKFYLNIFHHVRGKVGCFIILSMNTYNKYFYVYNKMLFAILG
jgi:hypothetical protein